MGALGSFKGLLGAAEWVWEARAVVRGYGGLRGPRAPGKFGRRPLTLREGGAFTVAVVVVIPSVPIIIAVLKWELAGFGL